MAAISDKLSIIIDKLNSIIIDCGGAAVPYSGSLSIDDYLNHIGKLIDLIPHSDVDAALSAILAESYAVGGTSSRSGEDTDNAKYYAQRAETYAFSSDVIAPLYDSEKTYIARDHVMHDGKLYRCVSDISTSEEWTEAHWIQLATSDELRELNIEISDLAAYQTETDLTSKLVETGSINYSDGTESKTSSALEGYTMSGFIHVSKGDLIEFSGIRNYQTYATIAFFDENKTYDQALSIVGTGSAGQKGSLNIPKNGYVRFTCRNQELESSAIFRIVNATGQKFNKVPSVNELKSFLDSGELHAFLDTSKWVNGSLGTNDGKTVNASKCRLSTTEVINFPIDTTLVIKNGWRIYTYYFDSEDTKTSVSSWTTGSRYIPAGSKCRFTFGRTPEDTTETLTLDVLKNVTIEYGIAKRIANIEDKISGIPSYWREYLEGKYPYLWAKDSLIGNGGDSFVFITDVHYERNKLNSPGIIKQIVNNTAVKAVFCNGDIIDHQDTSSLAIEKMEKWQSMMSGMRVFNIVGNHDNNNYDSSQPDAALTKGQYYGIMFKTMEQWVNTNGKLYYTIDNESQKIRYICLGIECFDSVGTNDEQRTWLQTKLTEKDSTWTVIVIQHRIWGSSTDSIDTKAQNVIDAINEVWSNINAKFIGILAGHTHLDYYTTESTNGYLLIACNCDAGTGTNSGYTRTGGTTNEQSIDIFYIDKTNEKLYAVRIGAGDTTVGDGTGIQEWSYGD